MSYTNSAGQIVNIGARVAYAGYQGNLYIGKVVSFTEIGSPRIEVEGQFVDMVRNRWDHRETYVKHAGANIWDRRPYEHWKHRVSGHLVDRADRGGFWPSGSERDEYDIDMGKLASNFIEFKVPRVVAIVKRLNVFVVTEEAK